MAILTAAAELTAEVGYAGLTIEGIAARSGAGKQTIYRWWASKADVLLDALATKADLYIPVPDEGNYRDDLRKFLTASFDLGRKEQVVDVLRALMAEAQINPEFGERFRDSFLQHRRDALGVVLSRAAARGDLPPDVPAETVTDIVFGTLWYRILGTRRPPDERLTEELVTTLTRRPE
jgi:AcrR family transcriptional regulator